MNQVLLLWKELKGELTAAEAKELADWLAQSPENQQDAQLIRRVWEKSGEAGPPIAADLNADFSKVLAKIRAVEKPVAKVVPMWQRTWLRAAAAVAFLLVSVWAFRQISPPEIPLRTVFANAGKIEKINLPDGSEVWLRPGSQLEFFPQFAENERVVTLDGEAFFKISHNPDRPFSVKTSPGQSVRVLGTEFNFKAKATEPTASVLVKSGKVRFEDLASGKNVVLTASQKAVFDKKAGNFKAETAQTLNDMAWQTGGLSFNETPVNQVVADFEKHYSVKVDLQNSAMNGCVYTSLLNDASPENALAIFAKAFGMKVEKTGEKTFRLTGGKCQ